MDLLSSPSSRELNLEIATLCKLCEGVNTPRSLAVYLLVKNGEWEQYLDLPMDYSDSRTVSTFADDYLVSTFLKKSPNLPLSVDKTEVAVNLFFENEERCRATNLRFKRTGLTSRNSNLLAVRREVARILGPLTQRDLESCYESFGFGPGANIGVRGHGMVSSDKFDNNITLTRALVPFYKAILGDLWWQHQSKPEIVMGNRFTTVPKDARKDRGICVEPLLNSYVQLGIGSVIRSKLRASGINLNSQTRNQTLASLAQARGLATIDLESASDTVSLEVVRELLPPRWFELLSIARSNYTIIGDRTVELEKFSSMGNGYTFELESLLFWAIVRAVVPSGDRADCAVYGDDIICPQGHAAEVIDTLEFFGFKVNTSKSFLAGCFFESCGTDWFLGANVRPIYAKGEKDEDDPHGSIPYPLKLANKVRLYANMRAFYEYCDDTFRPTWAYLVSRIPTPWRNCQSSPEFGDVGVIVDRSELRARSLHREGKDWYEGGRFKSVQMKPKRIRKDSLGRHLIALRNIGVSDQVFAYGKPVEGIRLLDLPPTKGFEPRRGLMGRPITKWTTFLSWSEQLN